MQRFGQYIKYIYKKLISYYNIEYNTIQMFSTLLYFLAMITAPTFIKFDKPLIAREPVYYYPPSPPPPTPIYIWVGYRDNNKWNEPTEDYDGDSS